MSNINVAEINLILALRRSSKSVGYFLNKKGSKYLSTGTLSVDGKEFEISADSFERASLILEAEEKALYSEDIELIMSCKSKLMGLDTIKASKK